MASPLPPPIGTSRGRIAIDTATPVGANQTRTGFVMERVLRCRRVRLGRSVIGIRERAIALREDQQRLPRGSLHAEAEVKTTVQAW